MGYTDIIVLVLFVTAVLFSWRMRRFWERTLRMSILWYRSQLEESISEFKCDEASRLLKSLIWNQEMAFSETPGRSEYTATMRRIYRDIGKYAACVPRREKHILEIYVNSVRRYARISGPLGFLYVLWYVLSLEFWRIFGTSQSSYSLYDHYEKTILSQEEL